MRALPAQNRCCEQADRHEERGPGAHKKKGPRWALRRGRKPAGPPGPRVVKLEEGNEMAGLEPNSVRTAKYNVLTFAPIFLWEMFSRAAYLYFLVQACRHATLPSLSEQSLSALQIIPSLRVRYATALRYKGGMGICLGDHSQCRSSLLSAECRQQTCQALQCELRVRGGPLRRPAWPGGTW
jgi:hypothetical protein